MRYLLTIALAFLCTNLFSQTTYLISDGGSTECSGILYDSGGPDGNYSDGENFVFTICPDPAPVCINFTLFTYNTQGNPSFGFGDRITFYDGDSNNGGAIEATSGGGACYEIQAASGCLTVEFESNNNDNMEGFFGGWECSDEPCIPVAPLNVNNNPSSQDILDALNIALPGSVTVDAITCNGNALGTFTSPPGGDLGIDQGFILTTGSANYAVGPNNAAGDDETILGEPGDDDLAFLSELIQGDNTITDACIVELDIEAIGTEISLEYIFGSDEYNGNVNDNDESDVMGIFISGPGIVGEVGLNGQENIATLPGTTTPVHLDNVNFLNNYEYFRDNDGGKSSKYDGLTTDNAGIKKTLTASATTIPCNTYHVKIAIGDAQGFNDGGDSGLFIGEINTGLPSAIPTFSTNFNSVIEGCTQNDQFNITIDGLTDDLTLTVNIGGTATLGTDYTLNIPNTIVFTPTNNSMSFDLDPISDNMMEGTETVELTFTADYGCGAIPFESYTIEINDEPNVQINGGQDSLLVCSGTSAQLIATGADTYSWTPTGNIDDPNSATPTITPTNAGFWTVEGTIGQCTESATIWVEVVNLQADIQTQDPTDICEGSSVNVVLNNNVNDMNITWSPTFGVDNPTSPNPTLSPTATTTYTATIDLNSCSVTSSITINVDPFDFPELTTTDTTLCQGQLLQLAEEITNTTTSYSWNPAAFMNDSTLSGPFVIPLADITYTLTATSQNGNCVQTATVDVEVIPGMVEVTSGDYAEICLGESIDLTADTTGTGMNFQWTPTDGTLTDSTSLSTTASPTVTTNYVAQMMLGPCLFTDTVTIRVDSLPDLNIEAIPAKDMYCEGDIISLVSANYENSDFPGIMFQWMPPTGAQSPLDQKNLAIIATESTTYTRITTNHACMDTNSIFIEVIPVDPITVTPDNAEICPGDNIQLNASHPDTDDFTWTPENTLSCAECPDPMANPDGTTTYTVEAEVMGCPVSETVTVNVTPWPLYEVPNDPVICEGDQIVLNNIVDTNPNVSYSWTSTPAGFTSDEAQPSVSPLETTTYNLTVNWACPAIETDVTVDVVYFTSLMLTPDTTICIGDEATLTASTGQPGTYSWTPTGGNSSTITDAPNVNTTYNVSFTSVCETLTGQTNVDVAPPISIENIETAPIGITEISQGENITLNVLTDPVGEPGTTIEWFANENSVGTGVMITDTPLDNPTVYNVVVTSINGCVSEDEISITVIEPEYDLPNAFTPDLDGTNDEFKLLYSGNIRLESFVVFDRWGQRIYEGDDIDQGWDGTLRGKRMPSDVYVYVVKLLLPTDEIVTLKGDLTLLR